MSKWTRVLFVAGLTSLLVLMLSSVALADPLDDAQAKISTFLTKASTVVTALIPLVGGVAVTGLAVKRKMAKAMGEDDTMARTGNQIVEVLKLTAIGTGASLLVGIAGMVLK